jgi:hypothetical protein
MTGGSLKESLVGHGFPSRAQDQVVHIAASFRGTVNRRRTLVIRAALMTS